MIITSSSNRALRIVILGSSKTGKSGKPSLVFSYSFISFLLTAVTVRWLTKRFIGEYSSSKGKLS